MVRILLPAAVPSAAASHHWVPKVLPSPPPGPLGSLSGWVIVGSLPRPGEVNSCCVALTFQALPGRPLLLTGRENPTCGLLHHRFLSSKQTPARVFPVTLACLWKLTPQASWVPTEVSFHVEWLEVIKAHS